jgi:hypothetical protein
MMEEAGAQGHAVLAPTAAAHPVPSTPSKSVAPHHVVQDLVRKIIAGVREAAVLPKAEASQYSTCMRTATTPVPFSLV